MVTRSSVTQYGHSIAVGELKQLPDRGHSLVVDHWPEVADLVLPWPEAHLV